jgi:hypothetical protein
MKRAHFLATLLLFGGGFRLAAQQAPENGAKELFFDPEANITAAASPAAPHVHRPAPHFDSSGRRVPHSTNPGKQRTLGLSYWIELVDASGTPVGPVTDAHAFKSGNRIRLHFRSNADGHILLVQLGSSGTSSVLFPDPAKKAIDNRLRAGDDHVLPSPEQWFTFDRTAGTETLLVLFARSQEELDRSFPTRSAMGARETGELLERVNDAPGRKDLFIETETHRPAEVGTYAVSTAGKPIIIQIVLKHR